MLSNLSKILVVDNDQREIDLISQAMMNLNIPASYVLYSPVNPPERPYKGIRLVFFDVQLLNGGGEKIDTSTITTFVNALKHCIDLDNGPFALIFWTSHIEDIGRIKEFINFREKNNVAMPLIVDAIDKTVVGRPEELSEAIHKILSNDILKFIFEYDSQISFAAGKTLKTLFNEVSGGQDNWGESQVFEQNLNPVLSTIAKEAVGFIKAKENQQFALKKSLEPILFDEIQKIELSEESAGLLQDLKRKRKNEIVFPEGFNHAFINNIFHIQPLQTNSDKISRGNVILLAIDSTQFKEIFGLSKGGLINKFFVSGARLEDASVDFVLMEISASCDYIQDKERLFKYVLGIKSSIIEMDSYLSKSDNLFFMPPFIDTSEYRLVFNNHFCLNLPRKSKLLGEPLIRIKDELLNLFSLTHSHYTTRPGIIKFDNGN